MNLSALARLSTIVLGVAVIAAILLPGPPALAVTGIINNNGVDVSDMWVRPGSPGSPGNAGSSGSTNGGATWLGPYKPTIPTSMLSVYCVAWVITPSWCGTSTPGVDPIPPEPVIPTLTLDDLSHVEPQSPTLQTEPAGWSVIGLPTNLVAHIATHEVSTVVFDRDVDVQFTPIRYDWAFGDGESGATSSPGATWEQLGQREFSSTPTSHRYRSLGAVSPQVTVTYSVAYRWAGQDWIALDGTLNRGASAPLVFVQNADTVLVTSGCRSARSAPGCDGN